MRKATKEDMAQLRMDVNAQGARLSECVRKMEETLYGTPALDALGMLGGLLQQAAMYGTAAAKTKKVGGLVGRVTALEDALAKRCRTCRQKLPKKGA